MPAQTPAQRQESARARKAMLGLTEVRGIFLPPDKHAELKRLANLIDRALKREKAKQ